MQWIEDNFANIATSLVEKLLLFMASWIVQILTEMVNFVGTWWLKIGAPSMGAGSATERVQTSTVAFVAVAGVIGTVFALIKLARDQDRTSAENLVMGMIRTVLTTAIAVSVVGLSLTVSDTVAPWLVTTISGSATEDGLGTAMGLESLVGSTMTLVSAGMILFIAPIALLGSILNAALVIFSYGIAGALCGLLPIFAASSVTERGRKAFDKATGWLIAVILFKPAAAVIYGFGLALIKGITGESDNDTMNRVISLLTGLVIICSASVALPALARIVVPSVGAGPQGMGATGLAMLGGALAVGAITGGLGAGAGAAAGGSAAAGGGAAAAGGEAAAAGGGAAAAGGGTAAAEGSAGATGSAGAAGSSAAGEAGGTGAQPSTTSSGSEPSSASGPPPDSGGGASSSGEGQPPSTADGPATSTGADSSSSGTGGSSSGADSANDSTSPNSNSTDSGAGAGTDTSTGNSGSAESEGTGSQGGPSGSENSATDAGAPASATGEGAATPTTDGAQKDSVDGTKSAINAQRLEFAMREAARDAENSLESGNEP